MALAVDRHWLSTCADVRRGFHPGITTMNISRIEQRVLHVLAQGGYIRHLREDGRICEIECYTREGYVLSDCTMAVFQQLRRKRLIESRAGSAYRISLKGRINVRAQANNR